MPAFTTGETFYIHEPQRKCRTILDAEREHSLENVLVIVDDLALPFGTLRLKGKGSDAGHNGLKHYCKPSWAHRTMPARFGIGNEFPRGGQIDYVLGHFTDGRLEDHGRTLKDCRRYYQKLLPGRN